MTDGMTVMKQVGRCSVLSPCLHTWGGEGSSHKGNQLIGWLSQGTGTGRCRKGNSFVN